MKNICFYKSPLGEVLKIVDDGTAVKEVSFVMHACGCCLSAAASPIGMEVIRQLSEYYDGKRTAFDLPLQPEGTDFQKRVWNALYEIPYGETRSYKQVAEAAGCPRGARAAGNANNRNPICIIIPCHRCIAADGTIGGFECGTEIKEKLLELEGVTVKK